MELLSQVNFLTFASSDCVFSKGKGISLVGEELFSANGHLNIYGVIQIINLNIWLL